MKIKKLTWLVLSGLIINSSLLGNISLHAKQAQLSAQSDFLFMQYRQFFRESPKSKKGLDALFAMGEYYFLMSDFDHANECFQLFLKDGKSKSKKLFTYAYLVRISEIKGNKKQSKELSKELMLYQKNIFIFNDSKQYKFQSPFKRRHKIVYSIDKVEFFVEGKSFEKITL